MDIAFCGKTMENIKNRFKMEFIKKDIDEKSIKQQSKLKFNGNQITYTIDDGQLYKQNEVLLDRPISLGFAVLELIRTLMYES